MYVCVCVSLFVPYFSFFSFFLFSLFFLFSFYNRPSSEDPWLLNEAWTYFSFSTLLSQHPETIERRESRVRRTPERRFKLSEHHFSIFYSVSFFIFIFFFLEFFFTLWRPIPSPRPYSITMRNPQTICELPIIRNFEIFREISTCSQDFELFASSPRVPKISKYSTRSRNTHEISTCSQDFELFASSPCVPKISKYSTRSRNIRNVSNYSRVLHVSLMCS